jgi:Xaa-Pro aminopeptidase
MVNPSHAHPYAQRRDKLVAWVAHQALDGFLVTNPTNVRYLTGFTGEASYLLINEQKALFVSDGRFSEQLQEECPGISAYIRPPGQKLVPAVAQELKALGWTKVGCEAMHLTLAEFEVLKGELNTVTWKPTTEAVEQLRMVKDDTEIAAIRQAIQIAELAFSRFLLFLRPTDHELGLHHRMEMLLRDGGAEAGSFPAIIAAGPRSALPHAPPTPLSLQNQDVLLLDWGARANGYVSDLTRTCMLRKPFNPRLKDVYEAVLAAHESAVAALRPKVPAFTVDAAARKAIEDRGLTPYSHGLGHGLGLDVHEAPQMRPGIDLLLAPGMVVTIEPGIYEPGLAGVRIEDDYLITADGCERLTTLPHDFDTACLNWQ